MFGRKARILHLEWGPVRGYNLAGLLAYYSVEWNSTFFAFSLMIEGTTEKVLQFIMPLKSSYNKNLGFNEQKCIFEHYKEVQTRKTKLTLFLSWKKIADDLFRVAPYRLILVLHKYV